MAAHQLTWTVPVSMASEMRMAWLMSRVKTQPCRRHRVQSAHQNHMTGASHTEDRSTQCLKTRQQEGLNHKAICSKACATQRRHLTTYVPQFYRGRQGNLQQIPECALYKPASGHAEHARHAGGAHKVTANLLKHLISDAHLQGQVVGVAVVDGVLDCLHTDDGHHRAEGFLPRNAHFLQTVSGGSGHAAQVPSAVPTLKEAVEPAGTGCT